MAAASRELGEAMPGIEIGALEANGGLLQQRARLVSAPPRIGVLALQGGFEAHARRSRSSARARAIVRVPADLDGLDGLVMPGGESTTMTLGIEREELAEPLREFVRSGRPTLGTCAGLIMLDRAHLGPARRERAPQRLRPPDRLLRGRPRLRGRAAARRVHPRPVGRGDGDDVEVLAEVDGHPVAVRQGNVLAVAFHPELTDERRLHRWLLDHAGVARVRDQRAEALAQILVRYSTRVAKGDAA